MHSTNSLDDGYLGSGVYLTRSIRKHGRNNHVLEILEFLPDKESLKRREIEIITEDLMSSPGCMNIKLGGQGGWTDEQRKRGLATRAHRLATDPEYRKWMSELNREKAMIGADERRVLCSNALKACYENPEFMASQVATLKIANAASHTPAAKLKRFENRKRKNEAGWRYMRNPASGKRKFLGPTSFQDYLDTGWVFI